jgi:hypothetical protein
MVAEALSARTRVPALAIAVVALAHALFFFLIMPRGGPAPRLADASAVNVQLAPPWHRPSPKTVPPQPDRGGSDKASPQTAPSVLTADTDDSRNASAPVVSQAPAGLDEGVRRSLRGLLGCDRTALLTPEERERCRDRLAAAGRQDGPSPPKLNFDRRGEFAPNADPYLARRPKNGCKLGAAGSVSVMEHEGAAAGVWCGWSF